VSVAAHLDCNRKDESNGDTDNSLYAAKSEYPVNGGPVVLQDGGVGVGFDIHIAVSVRDKCFFRVVKSDVLSRETGSTGFPVARLLIFVRDQVGFPVFCHRGRVKESERSAETHHDDWVTLD